MSLQVQESVGRAVQLHAGPDRPGEHLLDHVQRLAAAVVRVRLRAGLQGAVCRRRGLRLCSRPGRAAQGLLPWPQGPV